MQTDNAASSVQQISGPKTHKRSRPTMSALGALIGSFIAVVGWGALFPAPPGSRSDVVLLWLGAWVAVFALILPFTLMVMSAGRRETLEPGRELLISLLFSLVIAVLFGYIVFRLLTPARSLFYYSTPRL